MTERDADRLAMLHLARGIAANHLRGPSTELAVRETTPDRAELRGCQDTLADIEIHIYEAWTFERLTKDAVRHFLVIADICGWTMPWVEEMREWVGVSRASHSQAEPRQ